jgi:hypothetical protein
LAIFEKIHAADKTTSLILADKDLTEPKTERSLEFENQILNINIPSNGVLKIRVLKEEV